MRLLILLAVLLAAPSQAKCIDTSEADRIRDAARQRVDPRAV